MAKRSNKGKTVSSEMRTIRKLDGVTWLMLGTLIICSLSIAVGGVFYYLGNKAKEEQEVTGFYHYDDDLNFSVVIPDKWAFETPQKEMIQRMVDVENQGVLWDMTLHKLPHGVVPLVMMKEEVVINDQGEEVLLEENKAFVDFMTLAFRGFEEEDDPILDQLALMDNFKEMLTAVGLENITIEEVVDGMMSHDAKLPGVYVKASADAENARVNYVQYSEYVGRNVLVVASGSTVDFDTQIKNIEELVTTVYLHRGGVVDEERVKKIQERLTEENLGTDIDPNPKTDHVPYEDKVDGEGIEVIIDGDTGEMIVQDESGMNITDEPEE